MAKNYKNWERLDNTAKIFPVIANDTLTNTYRICSVLNEEIDPVLLQEAVDKYATEDIYAVELSQDAGRDISVLTADVVLREEAVAHGSGTVRMSGGVDRVMSAIDVTGFGEEDKGFDAFELGLKSVDFAEKVEIAEVDLAKDQISSLEAAVEDVIKEQETVGEYTVVSGDTLSEIAIKVNIPMDRIVELNSDKLENENSMIRVGDKLTITLKAVLPGCERSAFFDADGSALRDTCVIKDGAVVNYHGSSRFGQYLGVKDPTGARPNIISVTPGTLTDKEIRQAPYIECASLSGIQLDLYNDYIGGEIRLAYYFDGEKKVPITGISISGKLSQVLSGMRLSNRTVIEGAYEGPAYLLMPNISIL